LQFISDSWASAQSSSFLINFLFPFLLHSANSFVDFLLHLHTFIVSHPVILLLLFRHLFTYLIDCNGCQDRRNSFSDVVFFLSFYLSLFHIFNFYFLVKQFIFDICLKKYYEKLSFMEYSLTNFNYFFMKSIIIGLCQRLQ